jgi:hypothetical protein
MEKQGGRSARTLSGKLIDANGRIGTLTISMSENNRASWVLNLAERDGAPVELKGELDIKFDGDRLQMKGSETVQDKRVTWEIDMMRREAGSYAREALVGQYSATGGGDALPLGYGVVVLWAFN